MLPRYRSWLVAGLFPLIGLLGVAGASGAESDLEVSVLMGVPACEAETPETSEWAHPGGETPPLTSQESPTDSIQQDQPVEGVADLALPPFPIEENDAVQRFVERFQYGNRRELIGRWLDRSTRYLSMIREVFRRKGLPEDLAFMAMVESGFNPRAVSRAGAKGLWQFMDRTARRYGLRVDRWVDERLDPEKSTEAAAEYLKDLFAQFGHWFLAQAAYNAGEVKLARAVERARTNDFWAIARGRWLRQETKQFVPQIQAVALIAREPERYGFQITPQPPMAYEVVSVPFSVDLKKLARLSGVAALSDLNPELRRGATPPGESYALKVPPGSAQSVQVALERLHSERAQSAKKPRIERTAKTSVFHSPASIHVVRSRDTLSEIAKRYGLTVPELIRLNSLDPEAWIYPGDRIRLAASTLPSEREPAD